jgi:hypothetical protein
VRFFTRFKRKPSPMSIEKLIKRSETWHESNVEKKKGSEVGGERVEGGREVGRKEGRMAGRWRRDGWRVTSTSIDCFGSFFFYQK